jgi:8-oxo-dGTP pyrophosphatase MutT (NUDIX family)
MGTRQDSAVLVPLFRDPAGAVRLVVVRRSEGGLHGGQLGFPGGKRERGDASPLATALREAQEEIGLAPAAVEVLATLPVLETFSTGLRIAPFLARIAPPAAWSPDPREIAEVLEVPLEDLARPESRGEATERFAGWREPRRIEFYRVGPHRLWGASYRILQPVLPRLLAGEWTL